MRRAGEGDATRAVPRRGPDHEEIVEQAAASIKPRAAHGIPLGTRRALRRGRACQTRPEIPIRATALLTHDRIRLLE